MLQVTSAIMILCGTVFGYFNPTVFYILTIASMCQLFIGTTIKIIYLKKV